MPWAISTVFHIAVLFLLVFMVWTANPASDKTREETIIPIANLSASDLLGGAPAVHLNGESSGVGAGLNTPSPSRLAETPSAVPVVHDGSRGLAMGPNGPSLIGIGGSNAVSGPESAEVSLGGVLGPGRGQDLADDNPFAGGTGGGQFSTSMYGLGGNAHQLVYLVDASGSLVDSFPFVIQELKRSITALSEKQEFTVIFFQGQHATEVPPSGLRWATAANKDQVTQWMDPAKGNIVPANQSNPIKALQLGLQYHPDLMFLLSDDITGRGQYEVDQRRLLKEIQRANTHGTKINTIQFIYPDPLMAAHVKGTMQLIAEQSGGLYKFLTGRELGIQ